MIQSDSIFVVIILIYIFTLLASDMSFKEFIYMSIMAFLMSITIILLVFFGVLK